MDKQFFKRQTDEDLYETVIAFFNMLNANYSISKNLLTIRISYNHPGMYYWFYYDKKDRFKFYFKYNTILKSEYYLKKVNMNDLYKDITDHYISLNKKNNADLSMFQNESNIIEPVIFELPKNAMKSLYILCEYGIPIRFVDNMLAKGLDFYTLLLDINSLTKIYPKDTYKYNLVMSQFDNLVNHEEIESIYELTKYGLTLGTAEELFKEGIKISEIRNVKKFEDLSKGNITELAFTKAKRALKS